MAAAAEPPATGTQESSLRPDAAALRVAKTLF
jgi:hypothetical protein